MGFAQADLASAQLGHHQPLAVFALTGHGHDPVERVQSQLGMLPLHDQAGQLRHGRQRTPRNDGASDQSPHGQVTAIDGVGPCSDHSRITELLNGLSQVARQGRQLAHFQLTVGHGGGHAAPAVQHLPLGIGGLDRFDAVNGLDQQAVFLIRLLHVKSGVFFDRAAKRHARQHRQGHRQHGHQGHRPGNDGDHPHKQNGKRQVRQDEQARRGQKIADRLEMPDLRSKRAHGVGSRVHADVQGFAEKHRRQFLINRFAGPIHHEGPHLFEHQLHDDRNDHTNGQHPQSRIALGRNHPVVDLHRVQSGHQPHHADHTGGHHGLEKHRAVAPNRGGKPIGRAQGAVP